MDNPNTSDMMLWMSLDQIELAHKLHNQSCHLFRLIDFFSILLYITKSTSSPSVLALQSFLETVARCIRDHLVNYPTDNNKYTAVGQVCICYRPLKYCLLIFSLAIGTAIKSVCVFCCHRWASMGKPGRIGLSFQRPGRQHSAMLPRSCRNASRPCGSLRRIIGTRMPRSSLDETI